MRSASSLGLVEAHLVREHELGSQVADAVALPRRLLDRHDDRRVPLELPATVDVGVEHELAAPRCEGVLAHPHLLGVLRHLAAGREVGQAAVGPCPQVPAALEVVAHRWQVSSQERQVDVLVLAGDPGERLDRPATCDPPRHGQPFEQVARLVGGPRQLGPVDALELRRRQPTAAAAVRRVAVHRVAVHRVAVHVVTLGRKPPARGCGEKCAGSRGFRALSVRSRVGMAGSLSL